MKEQMNEQQHLAKQFSDRHIGLSDDNQQLILNEMGCETLDDFIRAVVPASIRRHDKLKLDDVLTEHQTLRKLKEISKKNKVFRSCIGQGYYNCYMPSVIQRNILEKNNAISRFG